jgi:hypothetical protein
MPKSTRLRRTIYSHWLKYRPEMVKELTRTNELAEALRQAEWGTVDLLYELVSIKKMQYQAAWELATEEWRQPVTEARPQEPSSVNPTLNPHSSRLVTSE